MEPRRKLANMETGEAEERNPKHKIQTYVQPGKQGGKVKQRIKLKKVDGRKRYQNGRMKVRTTLKKERINNKLSWKIKIFKKALYSISYFTPFFECLKEKHYLLIR